MTPRVSVLLPVRDGASTLAAAVASVLAQTDGDLEVVVVDDGSVDGSGDVARSTGDPRVRVIVAGGGLVDALNRGLTACRGRYVARMDADDVARPERLARQLPVLEADPSTAVVDAQVELFRDGEPVPEGMRRWAAWVSGIVEPEDFDRELLIDSPIVHPAATFRREVVLGLGGYRHGPFPEDYDLWLRLHARGHRMRKVPAVLHDMRDRVDRLTRTDPRYDRAGMRTVRQAWLASTVLARPRRVLWWGGRKESRAWLRFLREGGHEVVACVDVDARRIGGERGGGVPVVGPEAVAGLDVDVALVGVAARGGREDVRRCLAELRPGWREGREWWAVR